MFKVDFILNNQTIKENVIMDHLPSKGDNVNIKGTTRFDDVYVVEKIVWEVKDLPNGYPYQDVNIELKRG